MLRKLSRYLLPMLLVFALALSSCVTRPLTAPLMLAQTRSALNRQSGVKADVLMEGKAEVSYSGMDFALPLKIKMNTQTAFGQSVTHMSGTVGTSVLGVALDFPLEIYTEAADGEATMYSRLDETAWTKASQPLNGGVGIGALIDLGSEILSGAVLHDGTTLCEGKECRQIDLTISALAIKQLLGDTAAFTAVTELAGDVPEDLEMTVSLFIDNETKLPARITAACSQAVHVMEYTLSDVKMEIVFTQWGEPESINIPPEALVASEQTAAPPLPPGVIS